MRRVLGTLLALMACDGTTPSGVGDLRIVFEHDSNLYTMRPDGSERELLTHITAFQFEVPRFSPAVTPGADQVVFYFDGDLWTVSVTTGAMTQVTHTGFAIREQRPAWSPGATHIAYQSGAPGLGDIYVVDARGEEPRQLTDDAGDDSDPTWAPGPGRIAFISDRDGERAVYTMTPDGADVQRVTPVGMVAWAPAWDPLSDTLAFSGFDGLSFGVFAIAANGSGLRQLADIHSASRPQWSPDGQHLVLVANTGGVDKIYLLRRDGTALTLLSPSNATDRDPAWLELLH